jgi:hypothetical protein
MNRATRPRRLGLATLVAATALAVPSGVPGKPDPPSGAERQYDRPARPWLESRHHRLRAARGSSCWSKQNEDGTGRSVCADTGPPKTKRRLPVRGLGVIKIDMGIPADTLNASLRGRELAPKRRDDEGVHWKVRLPERIPRTAVLRLGATYPQGDAAFGATLRRAKH